MISSTLLRLPNTEGSCTFDMECVLTLMNLYGQESVNLSKPRDECVLSKIDEGVLPRVMNASYQV